MPSPQQLVLIQSNFKSFRTVKRTIQQHYKSILNYFDNRSTNASAESFNSKIKGFRDQSQKLGMNLTENDFLCEKERVLDGYLDLIKMILPEILVEHFDLVDSKKVGERLNLYFEEKNIVPQEFNSRRLISKGFHKSITVQDFPLKGMFVFFHIKRRRWTDKDTSEIIQRDWTLVANGTRMTKEFAAFLKDINQY